MKLKSFGCSFIFGSDLSDDGRESPLARPSKFTYPALIAGAQGFEYACHARPGSGNFEILCRLIEHISLDEPAIFIINWSWIDRFSYIDESKRNRNNPLGWRSIMPIDTTEVAHVYYKNLHTQLRDKLETLMCVKSALDGLLATNRQFVMTGIDSLMWEIQWHCTDGMRWLQKQIQPYFSSFEGMSFLEWSQQAGFEISPAMHPLEPAHKAAADHMLAHWDDYIKS